MANRRGRIYPIVMLSLVFLVTGTVTAFASGTAQSSAHRTFRVNGSGTASGTPDMAVVTLGVQSQEQNVQSAVKVNARKMAAVEKVLKAEGVAEKDIITFSYNVRFVEKQDASPVAAPQQSSSKSAPAPVAPQPKPREPLLPSATVRGMPAGSYLVTDMIQVTVRDMAKVGTIVDKAIAAGANRIEGVSFAVSDPLKLEARARQQAYADAHRRAEQLAKLSGVTLGTVQKITDVSRPPRPVSSPVRFLASNASVTPVNPGQYEVTVTLQVVFEVH